MAANGYGNQIHDLENNGPGFRKTKRDDHSNRSALAQATKRPALGTITNNITRVQPTRAAKQQTYFDGQDENSYGHTGKQAQMSSSLQAYHIYSDKSEKGVAAERLAPHDNFSVDDKELELHPVVTNLPLASTSSVPETILRPIEYEEIDISSDSPMVLDSSVESQSHQLELSKRERNDIILNVPDYAEEIYTYLKQTEKKQQPRYGYMRKQPDITHNMRCILVDWLVEVAQEYQLHTETLYLAVSYIDRFLSQMSVLRGKLQLVGAASMFLAAKYEEIYPPDVKEFVYITDDTYTQKQVLRMEHLILKVLSFDVAIATPLCFLQRFVLLCNSCEQVEALAMYLCELTLLDADIYIKYLPSTLAASTVMLANHSLGCETWPSSVADFSGYTISMAGPCLQDVYKAWCNAPGLTQQAVRDKYKSSTYYGVSSLLPPSSVPSM